MSRLVALGIVVLGTVMGSRGTAEDWPEFRGPTGQGLALSAKLPLEWGPEKNVVWKKAVPGAGWSSPSVVAGRIFLTTAVPAGEDGDQSLRALCLNARDGKVVWDREVFRQARSTEPMVHSKNSHASPTPLVHDDRLYVHFGHQGTACLDLKGNIVWRKVAVAYQPRHGNGGSPIVVDDLLIFSCDGLDKQVIVGLDRKTGASRWQTPRPTEPTKGFSFGTPLLIDVKGRKQVVSQGTDVVMALDPASGREIWRVHYDGYSVIPRPVFGHGLVFVCTGYDTPSLLAIRPDGRGDVTETHVAWKARRNIPHTPSPLLVGADLYLVSDAGIASCLDARSGKAHWQERLVRYPLLSKASFKTNGCRSPRGR